MVNSEMLTTKSGQRVHHIGIGTWGIGGKFESNNRHDERDRKALQYSISIGQNHIDTAEVYGAGHCEEVVGVAINKLNRENLFLASKLWEDHVGAGLVRQAVEKMLKRLHTDYLDLLYIHKAWENWPWREAISQINELIDDGLVRGFGVSNFSLHELKEAYTKSAHGIMAIQLHHNLVHRTDLSDAMLTYCHKNSIQIIAYQPLERGVVLNNKTVIDIAQSRSIDPSQIALAWLTKQGIYSIPQSSNRTNILSNFASSNIKLSKSEMELLTKATE